MSQRTLNVLGEVRGSADQRLLVNAFKKNRREVLLYQDKSTLLAQIELAVQQGRKVVVCTNCLKDSQQIEYMLQKIPDRTILTLNSKTASA